MAEQPDAEGETQAKPHHGGPYDQTTRRPMGRQTCLVDGRQFNLVLPAGWITELRAYCDKRGMPVTKFVRFAISEMAKAKGITLPPAFAKGVEVNTQAAIEAKRKAQPAEGEGA